MKKRFYIFLIYIFFCGFTLCADETNASLRLVILGVAQDGGYPSIGCYKKCCKSAWENLNQRRKVACLAVVDSCSKQRWLFDATPDIKEQMYDLEKRYPKGDAPFLSGIFLTHAHIGHYLGLCQLGREVLGTRSINVYAMEKMSQFLEDNGPWNQLVKLNNISLVTIQEGEKIILTDHLNVEPVLVPHRGEYTETVGFLISGPNKRVLFIPDIDRWDEWDRDIRDVVKDVDLAFVDGTFFADGELPGRDMSKIPHPLIVDTMQLLEDLPIEERRKVHFIHFNHTNPAMWDKDTVNWIEEQGFHIALEGNDIPL